MKPKRAPTISSLKSQKKILQVLISHERRLQKLERTDRVVKGFTCVESTAEVPENEDDSAFEG